MSLTNLRALLSRRPSGDDRVLWAALDQVLASSANFIAAILIARWLGKEEFGRYAIAWLALVLAENVQIALITVPMQNFAGQTNAGDRKSFAGTILLQAAGLAVALAVLICLGARLSASIVPSWRLSDIALPLAVLVLVGQLAEIGRRYFYAFGPPVMSFVVNAVRYCGQFLGLLALALFAPSSAGLGAALAAMAGAAVAAIAVALPRIEVAWPTNANARRVTAEHWIYGRWLLLANLVTAGREAFVAALIGASLGLAEIGVFRAAQQLVNLVNIPAFAMHNVVTTPMGVAYAATGLSGVLTFARAYVPKYLAGLLACLGVIALAAPWLMPLLYGPAFAGYGTIVALLAVSVGLYMVRDACNLILRTIGRTDLPFIAVLAGTVASLLLAYPLVRTAGLVGAVIGEILFGLIALAVTMIGLKRTCSTTGGRPASATAPEEPAR